MQKQFQEYLNSTLDDIKSQGLYKNERVIDSDQQASIKLQDGREVLNMCANNYLGFIPLTQQEHVTLTFTLLIPALRS